ALLAEDGVDRGVAGRQVGGGEFGAGGDQEAGDGGVIGAVALATIVEAVGEPAGRRRVEGVIFDGERSATFPQDFHSLRKALPARPVEGCPAVLAARIDGG